MDAAGLGKRIHEVRKHAGMSSDKLAELCDMGSVHIRKIESGSKVPSIRLFTQICNVLQISPRYLLQDNLHQAITDVENSNKTK